MQREPSVSSEQPHQDHHPSASPSTSQYGSLHHELSGIRRVRSADFNSGSRNCSPGSGSDQPEDSLDAVDADQLDEKLRGLSLRGNTSATRRRPVAGQRVSEHENALTPPTPRQALGFKVIRRGDSSNGAQLTDFPNGQCLLPLRASSGLSKPPMAHTKGLTIFFSQRFSPTSCPTCILILMLPLPWCRSVFTR